MAPGSLPFILLFCDAFDFQYQSLTVLCSCLRKVTESQRSFTKNIDEKLTQIRWRELNPSLFLLELSVFCETHWFAVTFIFYPDVRGFVFAFTWGRISIQSSHPVLQVGLRLGWSHHQQLLLPASAPASTSEWEGCSWQWWGMPQSSIWQPRNIHSCPDGLRPCKAVPVLQRLYPESFPSSVQCDAGGGLLWYDDVGPKFFLILGDKQ